MFLELIIKHKIHMFTVGWAFISIFLLFSCSPKNTTKNSSKFHGRLVDAKGVYGLDNSIFMAHFLNHEIDKKSTSYCFDFDPNRDFVRIQFIRNKDRKLFSLPIKKLTKTKYILKSGDKTTPFVLRTFDSDPVTHVINFLDSTPINPTDPGATDGYKEDPKTLEDCIKFLTEQANNDDEHALTDDM